MCACRLRLAPLEYETSQTGRFHPPNDAWRGDKKTNCICDTLTKLIPGFDPLRVENPSFRGSGAISLVHMEEVKEYLHARLEEAQIPACSMGLSKKQRLITGVATRG